MANSINVIAFFVLLNSIGICYSEEIPKYSYINVTFPFGLDEREFVEELREAKVDFEEGRRDSYRHKVIQEYILKDSSIPIFNAIVQKLQLSRTEYTKPKETPKYSHVNITFESGSTEHDFLVILKEAKIDFEIAKRCNGSSPVHQEYVVEVSFIPEFDATVKHLRLSRSEYSKPKSEYVKIFLKKDDLLQNKLPEAGIELREVKVKGDSGTKAYVVEVSLIPKIEAIAKKFGISNIAYKRTRLCHISVTFTKRVDETTFHERLRRFHVQVEEAKVKGLGLWDSVYLHPKWNVDYFVEPHLFDDFAYALGVTLL